MSRQQEIQKLSSTLNAPKRMFWVSASKRARAAHDLSILAPEAIPDLIDALAGPGQAYAANGLIAVGAGAIPALLQALHGPGAATAAVVLKKIGATCVEDLIREFQGQGAAYAVLVLESIGPPALKPLIEAVENGDPESRMWAALTLERMGAWAAEAIPALEAAQNDPVPDVRDAARQAIQKIKAK
ncbi:MAG: HEAT repeat domain-containing protein [Anaerolineales bacterium]|nr:HEAT repeat domain-containing protein [Anaerolineales bacterium]